LAHTSDPRQARAIRRTYAEIGVVLLYDNPDSGNCYKVRLLLAHLGIEYTRRFVDLLDRSNRGELLGALNPALRIPTLVLPDGRPLGESGAILWFLGSETRFVPTGPYERAQVLQWMFFEQYDLEPAVGVVRFLLRHMPESEQNTVRVSQLRRSGQHGLAALDSHLEGREWLVGSSITVADIALYGYVHVAHEGGFDLDALPALRRWLARVAGEPGHVTMDA